MKSSSASIADPSRQEAVEQKLLLQKLMVKQPQLTTKQRYPPRTRPANQSMKNSDGFFIEPPEKILHFVTNSVQCMQTSSFPPMTRLDCSPQDIEDTCTNGGKSLPSSSIPSAFIAAFSWWKKQPYPTQLETIAVCDTEWIVLFYRMIAAAMQIILSSPTSSSSPSTSSSSSPGCSRVDLASLFFCFVVPSEARYNISNPSTECMPVSNGSTIPFRIIPWRLQTMHSDATAGAATISSPRSGRIDQHDFEESMCLLHAMKALPFHVSNNTVCPHFAAPSRGSPSMGLNSNSAAKGKLPRLASSSLSAPSIYSSLDHLTNGALPRALVLDASRLPFISLPTTSDVPDSSDLSNPPNPGQTNAVFYSLLQLASSLHTESPLIFQVQQSALLPVVSASASALSTSNASSSPPTMHMVNQGTFHAYTLGSFIACKLKSLIIAAYEAIPTQSENIDAMAKTTVSAVLSPEVTLAGLSATMLHLRAQHESSGEKRALVASLVALKGDEAIATVNEDLVHFLSADAGVEASESESDSACKRNINVHKLLLDVFSSACVPSALFRDQRGGEAGPVVGPEPVQGREAIGRELISAHLRYLAKQRRREEEAIFLSLDDMEGESTELGKDAEKKKKKSQKRKGKGGAPGVPLVVVGTLSSSDGDGSLSMGRVSESTVPEDVSPVAAAEVEGCSDVGRDNLLPVEEENKEAVGGTEEHRKLGRAARRTAKAFASDCIGALIEKAVSVAEKKKKAAEKLRKKVYEYGVELLLQRVFADIARKEQERWMEVYAWVMKPLLQNVFDVILARAETEGGLNAGAHANPISGILPAAVQGAAARQLVGGGTVNSISAISAPLIPQEVARTLTATMDYTAASEDMSSPSSPSSSLSSSSLSLSLSSSSSSSLVLSLPPPFQVPSDADVRRASCELILARDISQMSRALDDISEQRRPWLMAVVNAARVAVSQVWKGARLEIYGSFASGLAAPSSDIDLVVCDMMEHYQYVLAGGDQDWEKGENAGAQTVGQNFFHRGGEKDSVYKGTNGFLPMHRSTGPSEKSKEKVLSASAAIVEDKDKVRDMDKNSSATSFKYVGGEASSLQSMQGRFPASPSVSAGGSMASARSFVPASNAITNGSANSTNSNVSGLKELIHHQQVPFPRHYVDSPPSFPFKPNALWVQMKSYVHILSQHLTKQAWIQRVVPIDNTSVPIVKATAAFAEAGSLIQLDFSFDSPSHRGLSTCAFVKGLMKEYPALSPLCLIIKQFLYMKGLNDPYTGGISSYGLVLMIVQVLNASLKSRKTKQQNHISPPLAVHMPTPPARGINMGTLLIAFFRTYGRNFDPYTQAISVKEDELQSVPSAFRQHPLVIIDPFDPMNNVGRGCWGIRQVMAAFDAALTSIERAFGFAQLQAFSMLPSNTKDHDEAIPSSSGLVSHFSHNKKSNKATFPVLDASSIIYPGSMLGAIFDTDHHMNVVSYAQKMYLTGPQRQMLQAMEKKKQSSRNTAMNAASGVPSLKSLSPVPPAASLIGAELADDALAASVETFVPIKSARLTNITYTQPLVPTEVVMGAGSSVVTTVLTPQYLGIATSSKESAREGTGGVPKEQSLARAGEHHALESDGGALSVEAKDGIVSAETEAVRAVAMKRLQSLLGMPPAIVTGQLSSLGKEGRNKTTEGQAEGGEDLSLLSKLQPLGNALTSTSRKAWMLVQAYLHRIHPPTAGSMADPSLQPAAPVSVTFTAMRLLRLFEEVMEILGEHCSIDIEYCMRVWSRIVAVALAQHCLGCTDQGIGPLVHLHMCLQHVSATAPAPTLDKSFSRLLARTMQEDCVRCVTACAQAVMQRDDLLRHQDGRTLLVVLGTFVGRITICINLPLLSRHLDVLARLRSAMLSTSPSPVLALAPFLCGFLGSLRHCRRKHVHANAPRTGISVFDVVLTRSVAPGDPTFAEPRRPSWAECKVAGNPWTVGIVRGLMAVLSRMVDGEGIWGAKGTHSSSSSNNNDNNNINDNYIHNNSIVRVIESTLESLGMGQSERNVQGQARSPTQTDLATVQSWAMQARVLLNELSSKDFPMAAQVTRLLASYPYAR